MAQAFYSPSADSFPDPKPYFHPASRTWFQISAKDGAWFQRSWQIGPGGKEDGKEDNTGELRIDYIMGSGNHVRTYLHRTARNALIELPLARYAENGGAWAMNPGYDSDRPPVTRKVGYDCMFCHNAYPSIPAGHEDAGAEPVFSLPLERHGKEAQSHGEVVPYGDADGLYTAVAQVAAKSNLDAGISRLEAAVAQRKPAQAGSYIELGDAYCNTNQFAKAIEPYQQALAREPGSVLILRRLSNAFRGSGQQRQALDALVRATQSDILDEKAWYDLALVQADLGHKQDAIASLRKATELDPELPDAENSLSAILAETGQLDLAEAAFRSALRIALTLAAAHANLANLLASKGNLTEAVWHYERASGKAVDQFNYGIALARMNRLVDAQTHIEAALKDDPNLAIAHDVLGGLLENRGRIDAALVEYREAVRLPPNFGKAHLDLGSVLATRHDRTGAAEEFRKAASDPDPEIRREAALALQAILH